MSKKEILLLFAALGFLIIWILDLRAGLPAGLEPTFWNKIFYHYSWLMFAAGCLFYFQYSKQIRLKKLEQEQKNNPVEKDLKEEKKEQRKAILKGKK
jgi:amino acid permease